MNDWSDHVGRREPAILIAGCICIYRSTGVVSRSIVPSGYDGSLSLLAKLVPTAD
jgi:hypothetical protein